MPCLMAWVLERRDTRAEIALSMSERTEAIARCSSNKGIGTIVSFTCLRLVCGYAWQHSGQILKQRVKGLISRWQ